MKSYVSILAISLFVFMANTSVAEDNIVATVNGKKITSSDLDEHINVLQRATRKKVDDRKNALEDLISREVLHQEALKQNIHKKKNIIGIIKFQERELLTQALLSDSEASKKITESELKKLYDEKIKPLDIKEYKVRHIVFKKDNADAEKNANTVIAELDTGKDFSALATEKSQDPSASKGGDIGWLSEPQLRSLPGLAQALSEMKKGAYSKKPVQSNIGWHVIKLEDIRKQEPATFEQTKKKLHSIVQQQNIQNYVKKLRDKANVDIKLK